MIQGADLLRAEWESLVQELEESGRIEASERKAHLTIVGLVGSIDNDMSLTDVTIGAFTSLHR